MRRRFHITALLLSPLFICAQTPDSSDKKISGNAAMYYYFFPGDHVPPTFTSYIDTKKFHYEARFNYEDINSVSFFTGRKFEKDKNDLSISVTPMAGILIGRTDGVLPGLEFEIDKSIFKLYSENEYLISFAGRYGDFFYSWSQLSASITKNISGGLAAQTLRFYQTKFDVQKGPYLEFTTGHFLFDAYCFNPFTSSVFYTVAINYNF